MTTVIHKAEFGLHEIDSDCTVVVDMPSFAEILAVADQHQSGCQVSIWYRGSPEAGMVRRRVHIVGTGHSAPNRAAAPYIGTVIMHHGKLVLHFFDGGEA